MGGLFVGLRSGFDIFERFLNISSKRFDYISIRVGMNKNIRSNKSEGVNRKIAQIDG